MKSLNIQRYTHVPLYVNAVRVTAENIDDVAKWCEGTVGADGERNKYIKVATIRPLRDRQTQAYIGDWVLKTDQGLKVYTNAAFKRGFVVAPTVEDPSPKEALLREFVDPRRFVNDKGE